MMTSHGKRQHARKNTAHEMKFTVINTAMDVKGLPERQKKGVVIDSSPAGVGFMTSDPLEPGNYVELHLSGARRSGVVMWTLNEKSEYRVGVRFLGGGELPHEAAIL